MKKNVDRTIKEVLAKYTEETKAREMSFPLG